MNNPKFVKIDDEYFEINTSYRTAIECNTIATNRKIGDTERALAIIYKLFGEKGLNSCENYDRLLELAKKYLYIGKEETSLKDQSRKPDMDYVKDMNYIKVSFISDYNIDLDSDKYKDMHWWTFYNLINGLSNSEFGNCCILNRVRNIRNMELSQIKDVKERQKIAELQKELSLDLEVDDIEADYTEKEKERIKNFYKSIGKEK